MNNRPIIAKQPNTAPSALRRDENVPQPGNVERVRRLQQELELIQVWDQFDTDKHSRKARQVRQREIQRELRDETS